MLNWIKNLFKKLFSTKCCKSDHSSLNYEAIDNSRLSYPISGIEPPSPPEDAPTVSQISGSIGAGGGAGSGPVWLHGSTEYYPADKKKSKKSKKKPKKKSKKKTKK